MENLNNISSLDMVRNLFWQYGKDTSLVKHYNYKLITEDRWLIEIINRRLTYSQFIDYNETGFIMENYKYEFLRNYTSRYINTFKINNVAFMLIWNVENINCDPKGMECRKTAAYSNLDYINKEVILLKAENAKIFMFDDKKYKEVDYFTLINKIKWQN